MKHFLAKSPLYLLIIVFCVLNLKYFSLRKEFIKLSDNYQLNQEIIDSISYKSEFSQKLIGYHISEIFAEIDELDKFKKILVLSEQFCGPCNVRAIESLKNFKPKDCHVIGIYQNDRQFKAMLLNNLGDVSGQNTFEDSLDIKISEPILLFARNGVVYDLLIFN